MLALSHSKIIRLPFSGLGNAVIAAEWRLGASVLKPRVRIGLAMDDGTTVTQPRPGVAAVRLRKPVFLTKHWGVEVSVAGVMPSGCSIE